MASSAAGPSNVARCPICRNDSVQAYRPFCSKRCADIDLGKWFAGGYAVAGRDGDESDLPPSKPAGKDDPDDGG